MRRQRSRASIWLRVSGGGDNDDGGDGEHILFCFYYLFFIDANRFVHNKLRELKLPYFDAAAVLRSPQRCELSYNGLHVKMWVNIERVKMLFNHLCDEELNWVGTVDRFV